MVKQQPKFLAVTRRRRTRKVVVSSPSAEAPAEAVGEEEIDETDCDLSDPQVASVIDYMMKNPLFTVPTEGVTLRDINRDLTEKFPSGFTMRVIGDGTILQIHVVKRAERDAALKEGGFQSTLPIIAAQIEEKKRLRKRKKKLSAKALVRGLPWAATAEEVVQALCDDGFTLVHVRLHQKTNRGRPPLFIVSVPQEDRDKLMEVQHIMGIPVTVEPVPPHMDPPPQCFNCQRLGHVAKHCTAPAVCVRCAGSHASRHCTLRDEEKRRCANCGGAHVASWKGCGALAVAVAEHRRQPRRSRARQHGAGRARQDGADKEGVAPRPPHRDQSAPSTQPGAEKGGARPHHSRQRSQSRRAARVDRRGDNRPRRAGGQHSSAASRDTQTGDLCSPLLAKIPDIVAEAVGKAVKAALPEILTALKISLAPASVTNEDRMQNAMPQSNSHVQIYPHDGGSA